MIKLQLEWKKKEVEMMEAKKNIIQFVVEEKVSNEENSEYEID
jgi:hypothetical protein